MRAVREALPADTALPQHAFDALVSLCFNIGPGAFLRSGVLRRLRAGDRAGAAEAILQWRRPAEVVPRRQAEYDQFRTPYETALPRARRGDIHPIPRPVERSPDRQAMPPPSAEPPTARPSARRRPGVRPRPPAPAPVPASAPNPAPAAQPAPTGGLGRLWARLRTRVLRARVRG